MNFFKSPWMYTGQFPLSYLDISIKPKGLNRMDTFTGLHIEKTRRMEGQDVVLRR